MKIAIIGAGISGLVAANKLSAQHEVTLFEASERLGGHTATKSIRLDGQQYEIDTGFIVFNDKTYPQFKQLLSDIGVAWRDTSMGFSVRCDASGLEYSGSNLNTLFAQRRNLLSPYFLSMVRDILRFNRQALADLQQDVLADGITLSQYLHRHHYSDAFIQHYLAPMAAAIWSSSLATVLQFPALFFVRFFSNHGLLNIQNRPQWHTVEGGSHRYIAPLCAPFAGNIRLDCPVQHIKRCLDGVTISTREFGHERFDQVVIATHSDQALAMLDDACKAEQEVLSAIPYIRNSVVLHTDQRLLPRKRATWSSWNYRLPTGALDMQAKPVVTYNMNILQGIQSPHTFCVTLNDDQSIAAEKVLGHYHYAHPEFTLKGIAAQQRWAEINGVNRSWFCGAYWGNGFHEDGVQSALRVVDALNAVSPSSIAA